MQQQFISNPSPRELPRTADVVVIGGGPAGTAILWALERAAPQLKTILIEKSARLGAGSTLASLENYRTCWPTSCLAKQMTRSVEIFHHADDYLGDGASQSLALKEQGYLFCGFTEQQAHTLRQDVSHLNQMGLVHVEYLDTDEVRYRFGWLGKKIIAAKYDPIAGWLDSNALIYRYAKSARSAKILLDIPDTQIQVEHGKVVGVKTPNGTIAVPNVVIAAGANAGAVGRSAGIELPIVLRPRQSFTTSWRHEAFPKEAPMLIGSTPFPHVRSEAHDGAIFGWEYHWKHKNGDSRDALLEPIYPIESLKDPRFPSIVLAILARQFGHKEGNGFASSRYLSGIRHNIGYYVYRDETTAYTVDEHGTKQPYESERAILDEYPTITGLFLSIAHVGHGIMSSPAAGEIIASKILRQPLPDPLFAQFGLSVHWVEHDENAL